VTNSALLDLLQLAATYSTVPFHVSTPIGAASIHVPGMASAGLSQSQFSILMTDGVLHGATSTVLEYLYDT